ncbi:glycosyltransferase family 2 protein [Xanthobacter sp. V0B-10]|uniref:glycosyltransferase family 2 protein n=1 Tax=Xanthobacter albus TaxID=3119929 RepID=UPI00372BDDFF
MKHPYADALADMRVAVVIPCHRVRASVLPAIARIGPEVDLIYAVDDACPEGSGVFIAEHAADPRVNVLFHDENMGVGGATLTGMRAAVAGGADIIVKIDGDGQMDPALIPGFVGMIAAGEADYAKGNRFFEPESVARMPIVRLIGNAGLSFLSKLSTGYWQTMDPTNGYVAIHASLVELLPTEKIARRYFFESDLLFRLSILNAKVVDVPMVARYGEEISGLVPHREILPFAAGHLRNLGKRILYNYFIRGFSAASVELVLGFGLLLFGIVFGLANWGLRSPASAGTVMVAALPVIVGFQLLLAALNYDIQAVPRTALYPRLRLSARNRSGSAGRGVPPLTPGAGAGTGDTRARAEALEP